MSAPVLSWLFFVEGGTRRNRNPSTSTANSERSHGSPAWAGPPLVRSPSARFTCKGPNHSTLRANPFPEVTDLFCRLPLPTLFYRLEAVHLGDLMRLWVRPDKRINLSFGFSRGVRKAPDTSDTRCFPSSRTQSPANPIPGCRTVKKKRELFPDFLLPSPNSLMLPYSILVQVQEY